MRREKHLHLCIYCCTERQVMEFGLIIMSCVSISGFEMTRWQLCLNNFCRLFFFFFQATEGHIATKLGKF